MLFRDAVGQPREETLSTLIQGDCMPIVRIDLLEGKTPEYGVQVGLIVARTLTEVLNVPKDDLFQVITTHPATGLRFDREYLGIDRSDDCIFLQITLNSGRTLEMKQRFYKAVADGLHDELKLRKEDVLINLVEVPKENWSFGNGEAQYAPATP
jgi:phenylpyruvate tautomerase PptA (4-oxalocrotonate tautomerase family)